MKTLALRIYLAVVTVLLVFALVSGWLAQRHMDRERTQVQSQAVWTERAAAWAELLENSLPDVNQPEEEQARVFLEWADRLRMPMALDGVDGKRLATSPDMADRIERFPDSRDWLQQTRLSDGRTLWVMRPGFLRQKLRPGMMSPPPLHGPEFGGPHPPPDSWWGPAAWMFPPWLAKGASALLLSLVILFVAVAAGAWPVANRLTRRLQALRTGVEAFGAGQLQHRVAVEGRDEVAALAKSFNDAAQQIEDLINSNRSLLANASHELRSPLARLKMAVSIMADMPPERAAQLKEEIHQDIAELDALVEEVLLASRLDAKVALSIQPVDLLGMATEEAARVGAEVVTAPSETAIQTYPGDERLLRRAVRNLLENAKRYGGHEPGIVLTLEDSPQAVNIRISDRGPGVPADQCERIFEPFYRMPGHAEHAGGVGLGLSLVRQIARRHGGDVGCDTPPGGGGRFTIRLPR
ncbi:MAG: sensor histidine kinase [Acidobacteriota bacterium]